MFTKAYFDITRYLEGKETRAALAGIQKKFQLEKLGVDLELIVELLELGEVERADLADMLTDAWGIDFAKALEIVEELSLKVFLPIDDLLKQQRQAFLQRVKDEPGFKPLLVRIFEDMKKREEDAKVQKEQRTGEAVSVKMTKETTTTQGKKTMKDIVSIIQRECGLSFQDEHLAKRFESIVTSRFKEIRDEATVKDLLTRSTKVGGLSLEEEVVEKVLMLIAELRREFQGAIGDKAKDKDEVKGGVTPPAPPSQGGVRQNTFHKGDVTSLLAPPQGGKTPNHLSRKDMGEFSPLKEGRASPEALPVARGQAGVPLLGGAVQRTPILRSAAPTLTYRTKTKAQSTGEQGEENPDNDLAKQFQTWKEGEKDKTSVKHEDKGEGRGGVTPPFVPPQGGKTQNHLPMKDMGESPPLLEGRASPEALPAARGKGGLSLQASEEEKATLINKRLVRMSDKKDKDKAEEKKARFLEISQKEEVAKRAKPQEEEEYVSKLIDPLREIEMLTLQDFRRLSKNPEEACNAIENKIALLGKERSLQGRIDGIKAWQKSALQSEYLELGKERIVTGKSIEDITKEREEDQQATLSVGEFHAIMELNKRLRF